MVFETFQIYVVCLYIHYRYNAIKELIRMNVLITGGTSGIGLALAEIFAKEKYNLIIVSRTKNDLEKIKEFLEEKYKIM